MNEKQSCIRTGETWEGDQKNTFQGAKGKESNLACGVKEKEVATKRKREIIDPSRPIPDLTRNSFLQGIRRCEHPKSNNYPYYGARGIEFKFSCFDDFLKEVGERPSINHSLDRIDNNRHYEPGNIRWATRKEQTYNTRRNKKLTHNGVTKIVSEWAEFLGINRGTLNGRLIRGWCTACCLSEKINAKCCHLKPKFPKGEGCYNSKLKSKDIPKIRKMGEEGISSTTVANMFGVSRSTIIQVFKGRTWSHVN